MDRQRRLDGLLSELSAAEGVLAAALVSRDGLCVKAVGQFNLDRETFSAMSATAMGAAEIALSDVDGGRARSLVASTERAKVVIVGATRELLLLAYARPDAPVDGLLKRMEESARLVADAVAGG